jgi:hypothetical protein
MKIIIETHGGIYRWHQFSQTEAQLVRGGKRFNPEGFPLDSQIRHLVGWLRKQKA